MPTRTGSSRPSRSRALIAVAVGALLVVGLAACGDDDGDVSSGSGDGTTTTGGGEEANTVTAEDFSLTSVTVAPGAEVTFENYGKTAHTMTADDGAFDAGEVAPDDEVTVVAPAEAGAYGFHCEIHEAMTGTLTVEG